MSINTAEIHASDGTKVDVQFTDLTMRVIPGQHDIEVTVKNGAGVMKIMAFMVKYNGKTY